VGNFFKKNIYGAHSNLMYMIHILNLIYQSHIQHYLHILGNIPALAAPLWLRFFVNNSLSHNLTNSIGSEMVESDLIYIPLQTIFQTDKLRQPSNKKPSNKLGTTRCWLPCVLLHTKTTEYFDAVFVFLLMKVYFDVVCQQL
jgi:hypothetical protein